jgi:drug/metabolite transporter (DMT)-like permease
LAALLGIVVLAEPLDLRFVLAATAILGGIGLTLRRRPTRAASTR